jgi:hypothetical protein
MTGWGFGGIGRKRGFDVWPGPEFRRLQHFPDSAAVACVTYLLVVTSAEPSLIRLQRRLFLARYWESELGCNHWLKTECGRGYRYCEVV